MNKKLYFVRKNGAKGRMVLLGTGFKYEKDLTVEDFPYLEYFTENEISTVIYRLNSGSIRNVWKVTFNTSNLFTSGMKLATAKNVYRYAKIVNADERHRDNIYNRINRHDIINEIVNEKGYQEYLKEIPKLIRRELKIKLTMKIEDMKLKIVEFIPERNKTVLSFAKKEETDLSKMYRVVTEYDGEIGDKGYSFLMAFLYGVYKFKHSHLTGTAIQTKMSIVMKGLRRKQREVYLKSFFIESGLFSPTKSMEILKLIKYHDKADYRVEIKL